MRRLYLVLAALGIVCLWRSYHDPVRHHLGGQVCRTCGKPGRDRDELGEDGTVHGMRKYSRADGGTLLRGDRWFP